MSAQALVRVGTPRDLYYTDADNCLKQAIPVEYDTRFTQEFSNKAQGSSSFVIPPNQGVRHVLIVLGYAPGAPSSLGNPQLGARALEKGWGYKALENISFRVGGSSQYYLTGAQLLARNLRMCRTQSQRQAILDLGGQELKTAADFANGANLFAYIPVSIWCAPGEDELQLPLPTDLLSQQVLITASLRSQDQVFTAALPAGAGVPADVGVPSGFNTAYFQIEQLVMNDRGMALANRVDMATHMYSMPLPSFDQQEVLIGAGQLAPTVAPQSVVLTGFRAGQVKKLQIYLTKDSDPANSLLFYTPTSVQVLYSGLVYSNYQNGSADMWNLLDGTSPSAVNQSALVAGATSWNSGSALSKWVELPFAQPSGSDYESDILVSGKEITSGIVNMTIALPSAEQYTLHVVYVMNCTLAFSRGTADFVF